MTTKIEWTDATWNPTTGCDRVSPGCDNCYALTMAKRLKAMGSARYQNDGDPRTSGPGFKLTIHDDAINAPFHWRKPRRVFVNSMSDLFHEDVATDFVARVFAVMALTPQHTYQILTKRPRRMARILSDYGIMLSNNDSRPFVDLVDGHMTGSVGQFGHVETGDTGWPLPNVWLGTSIENDKYAFRADYLRDTPAAVRFISAEPLLGPLPSLDLTDIDWLIVGGESGPGARPMHPQWARDLRDRCEATSGWCDDGLADECCDVEPHKGTAFFLKQWGAWAPWGPEDWSEDAGGHQCVKLNGDMSWAAGSDDSGHCTNWSTNYEASDAVVSRVGKKHAGRLLDGIEWNEFPK